MTGELAALVARSGELTDSASTVADALAWGDAADDAARIDQIVPHRSGGPTTFGNGRAICVRSNQVRETPGWAVRLVHDGTGAQPHTVITVTPTGHSYVSRAGPGP